MVGGGIAGLSAAIALARSGYAVVVSERRQDNEEIGAGLQLSPNASHILIEWGLGPALARYAVAPTELAIRRWAEPRAYARMPLNQQDTGATAPFWVMMRADLHAEVRRAASSNPNITLHTGWSLERIKQDGKHVIACFSTGSETVEIPTLCLIGADGQHSSTRRLMGDARNLDSPGWEAWRTVIPAQDQPDFIRAATTNLWLGRHSHAVHYPVAGGSAINLVVIRRANEGAEGWSRVGDASMLDALAQSAAPTLRDLMAAAPSWSVWTLRDRTPSPYLAKGRMALIGDAAHPVLPFLAQGAAMAIEDAAVLANCLPLAENLQDNAIEPALKAYARQRAARVAKVHAAARSNASVYHLPQALAWFRDRRMAQLGPDGMRQRYSWLYDWRIPPKGIS
ncbi:MAG: FAD-dependent monooxygenase [Beijerinckiaceae bacterium]